MRVEARTPLRRPSFRVAAVLLVLGIAAGVLAGIGGWQLGADSGVYRAGALSLLHDQPLYGPQRMSFLPDWVNLPFIYPPAAAVLFLPLAIAPASLAWGLFVAASVFALYATVRAVLRAETRAGRLRPVWLTGVAASVGLTVLLIGLEPIWKTLFLGQINILLMALVVLDVLVVGGTGRRYGGMLIGVAAAVKLTPLIFVVHLLVVRRWADAARAVGTFLGLQLLAFLFVPGQAAEYWTELGGDLELVDTGDWIFNQSLEGTMLRLTAEAHWSAPVALGIGAVLAIPAVWLVRWFSTRGDQVSALLVTGFLGLLVSPISWTHHWVWAVPLLVMLLARAHWRTAGATLLMFASCVVMFVPNGNGVEFSWGPIEFLLGNSYVFFPVVFGAVLCVRALRKGRAERSAQAAG
ncbi:alpha-1,2-mannosyltransferase [Tamaricihabitans halophyticus]|uniref:Alpha-1,2-mannosyltransferase n=1 Tax=Tamaricihabitans halophyticus TaxID=1262583 RepID=A0A4R2R3C6_9PSEU|nr:glycosyltransferase 87 family protein [Tamaricihabitans halophyticus]TCP56098.1 alpha-1,2-mannosyltransferase [Tamaricihabitans halophyticus]